jgi:UDP-N-acetylglucosamine 2-epimerase
VSTGDIMYDSVLHYRAQAASTSSVLSRLALEAGGYGVVTLHRAQNTDDPARLKSILRALDDIARDDLPLIFPLHPRTASRLSTLMPNWGGNARLRIVEPLGYLDSLMLLSNARVCLTDSGGLQKEALFVGCPCVTLRSETEWVETLDAEANVLTDGDPARLHAAVAFWKERYPRGGADFTPAAIASFGPGNAAQAILDAIQNISVQESGSASDAARTSPTGRTELETTGAQ